MFNKRNLLILLVMLLSLTLLVACGGGDDVGDGPVEPSGPAFDGEAYTIFGKDAKTNFSIIYDADNTKFFANLAVNLCTLVTDKGLPKPAFAADRDKAESQLELLIGETNRALSAEAKAIVDEASAKDPNGKHWVWLYKEGQLALYANKETVYESAVSELTDKYFKDGVFKVIKDAKDIGYVKGPHDAYMSYAQVNNFFDAYTDPFGMKKDDYEDMTITHVDAKTYRISYVDDVGGLFTADFVQKVWGVWMMGAIKYTEPNQTVHSITSSSTDYEFVLRINGKGSSGAKSGNHGNYPNDKLWKPWVDPVTKEEDPTSYYNDMLLDITFYDGKSGKKLDLDKIGDSAKAKGIRIVEHHNVYEFNYTQENVLVNAERSYLYNGYDIMCDSKLYMTQDVRLGGSYSAMLPIAKKYGNCAMFHCVDGSTIFMKTPMSNTVNESVYGANALFVDLWGEENPKYHMGVKISNPEHHFMSPAVGKNKGYAGFREMLGSNSNKLYFQLFGTNGNLEWGDELHFNTVWSFSIQEDFKNPDREPDHLIGVKK